MTVEQAKVLNLGIQPIDEKTCLRIESAFNWVLDNTTLNFDINDIEGLKALPAQVRLFVSDYVDLMSISTGVSSESIEGLSQSFKSESKKAQIWELSENYLGKWLVSPVRFVPAVNRWSNGG